MLDDATYYATYRELVHEFADTVFTSTRTSALFDAEAAVIADSIGRERDGYTFTSSSQLEAAVTTLKSHAATRAAEASAF